VERARKQIKRIQSGGAWTKDNRQFLPEHMSARTEIFYTVPQRRLLSMATTASTTIASTT
jgi:hypothetical protein